MDASDGETFGSTLLSALMGFFALIDTINQTNKINTLSFGIQKSEF